MMQSGAVEKEKSSYARGPGFDSRPWNFFPFLGRFVLLRFFFQLFFSRARKSLSLSLSKAYRAGQGKDSKRLGTLSARLIAKKLCDMSSLNTQG